MREFDTERMCRLNGKQPTPRERWVAFYRLCRLAQGHGQWQDLAAADCFRVLCANWSWVRLIEAEEKSPSRVHYPAFLRRHLLRSDQRERRYGRHPEWQDRDRRVAAALRDRGLELTPGEVSDTMASVLRKCREHMIAAGNPLPADDAEALLVVREAVRRGKQS
jgi:hypothetical protein